MIFFNCDSSTNLTCMTRYIDPRAVHPDVADRCRPLSGMNPRGGYERWRTHSWDINALHADSILQDDSEIVRLHKHVSVQPGHQWDRHVGCAYVLRHLIPPALPHLSSSTCMRPPNAELWLLLLHRASKHSQ